MIVGCMTGTSLDGLDASLVEVTGEGLDIQARLVGMVSRELDGLYHLLKPMVDGEAHTPLDYLRASRQLGELHADAVEELCGQHLPAGATLDMVVAHGQTIWHAPDEGLSWQLFDPHPVARRLGVPVCFDLRQADLIAGGEGAPITPISDWVMYRHPTRERSIVNLGGISNVTHLPSDGTPDQITGADLGPCNLLIDGVVRQLFPERRFDINGEMARQGRVNLEIYTLIQNHPAINGKATRSIGREDFTESWVHGIVDQLRAVLSPMDIIAGAVEAAARVVAEAGFAGTRDVVLAGGGAKNPVLVERISAALNGHDVVLSNELGVPVDARESAGFAVLGALCQDGVSITLPMVTGANAPGVAGHWVYPGVVKR